MKIKRFNAVGQFVKQLIPVFFCVVAGLALGVKAVKGVNFFGVEKMEERAAVCVFDESVFHSAKF